MNPHRFNPFTLSGFKYSIYRIKKTRNQKEKHLFFSIFHLILLIFVLNPPLNYKLKDNLYVFSIPGDKGY